MSDQTLPHFSRIAHSEAAIAWLVATGVFIFLMAVGDRLLSDPDTYSHIALGRWILEHHAVPTSDPLSQTMHGAPWIRIRVAVPNCLCDRVRERRLGGSCRA